MSFQMKVDKDVAMSSVLFYTKKVLLGMLSESQRQISVNVETTGVMGL